MGCQVYCTIKLKWTKHDTWIESGERLNLNESLMHGKYWWKAKGRRSLKTTGYQTIDGRYTPVQLMKLF